MSCLGLMEKLMGRKERIRKSNFASMFSVRKKILKLVRIEQIFEGGIQGPEKVKRLLDEISEFILQSDL